MTFIFRTVLPQTVARRKPVDWYISTTGAKFTKNMRNALLRWNLAERFPDFQFPYNFVANKCRKKSISVCAFACRECMHL